MLPYSFRLALRHFSKKSVYSWIIVLSLTVGFACTCLLVSFLISESKVDSFHNKKERLFELTSNDPFGGNGRLNYTTATTVDYVKNYPEVGNICQVTYINGAEIEVNGNPNAILTIGVDTSFLTLFDFPVVAGTSGIAEDGMMISERKAQQLFGTKDVLGRAVNLRTPDSVRLVSITGVLGEAPEKSHLKFDAIVGHSVIEPADPQNFRGGVSYVLLQDAADPSMLAQKINSDSLRPSLVGKGALDYSFEPVEKAYTSMWNRAPYMQTRSETFMMVGWVVAGLIMFMASFNFLNLFLLSMQERKKETGIQKTLGISGWQTLRGSSIEAGIYICLSFVLSLVVVYTIMPVFNNVLKTDLAFDYLSRFRVIALIGGMVLLVAVVVVAVATRQQRRVLPISMMRNMSAKVRFSKLFFTLQFFVSITLCVCAITIIKQMKFVETAPLGFNRNILELKSPRKESGQRLTELKTLISTIPGIEHVAQSGGNPISGNMIAQHSLEDGTPFNLYIFDGDEDLVKTLHLELVKGTLDLQGNNKLVNETFVKGHNMKDPIGSSIPGQPDGKIVGIVKDFTCASFKQEIPPVVINYKKDTRRLLIDYAQNDLNVILPKIKAAWTEIFPGESFEYNSIQDDLMKKYGEETLFYKIVLAASITTMIISCFGLFALSWAVIQSRSKEMGIRKILGAGIANILGLLTISFAKRLVLAFVLAAPAGYYLMNLWLARFVNKAPIDSWTFVLTGIALAAIAIVTLGVQTLKASLSSPLEEIRE